MVANLYEEISYSANTTNNAPVNTKLHDARTICIIISGRWPIERYTEKSFRNLINSNWNQIVYTIFRLIWNQTDFRLVTNQSKNGKYNLISVWFNKIPKKISLCEANWRELAAPLSCGASSIIDVQQLFFVTLFTTES